MTHYCPSEDSTCPYYNSKTGICSIGNPLEECDDYYYWECSMEEDE